MSPRTAGTSAAPPALLLLLLDSRSPAGAHSHSGGMEGAVTAGLVQGVDDVAAFCRGRLRTAAPVFAAFAAASCQGWAECWTPQRWQELDAELGARLPSEATRAASRATGRGLLRLLRASVPDVDLSPWQEIRPAPHHPLVLGACCAVAGADPATAGRAAALSVCTAAASAAVRLLGLDPYAVHRVLAGLGPLIDAAGDDGAALAGTPEISYRDWPSGSAPVLDLLADFHATQEVRLFAS